MRGNVLDDFRDCLVDILQSGIVQPPQCCVGLGEPQSTEKYLVVIIMHIFIF